MTQLPQLGAESKLATAVEDTLAVASIAGLFSLLGALLGALLARHTQQIQWLRRNRSETFARFLTKLFDAQRQSIDLLFDNTIEAIDRDIKVTDAYSGPEHYSHVVRLYLPESQRDEFSTLVREIRALHANVSLGDSRLNTMIERIARIQEIFEGALDG